MRELGNVLVICNKFGFLRTIRRNRNELTVRRCARNNRVRLDYHSSILLPWCQPTLTNTLPRHFRRGQASHKPFDFLPSFYTFYMFLGRRSLGEGGYTAKTFSVHRRVHNHYSKRILNLILNRKKFLGQGNEGLDKQKTAANAAVLN